MRCPSLWGFEIQESANVDSCEIGQSIWEFGLKLVPNIFSRRIKDVMGSNRTVSTPYLDVDGKISCSADNPLRLALSGRSTTQMLFEPYSDANG